jgi:hypothetical protein
MSRANICSVIAGVALIGIATGARADVVNVDFAALLSDTTHSGNDGALSTGGTVWNQVLFNTSALDIDDENGATTPVDVDPTGPLASNTNASSLNDLQDSGLAGDGFDIADLVSGERYEIAVYGGVNMGFAIEDANGVQSGICTASPTFLLPGSAAIDYCEYNNLLPFDLGTGIQGIRITFVDGLVTGFQLSGNFVVAAAPSYSPQSVAGLMALLAGAGVFALGRRRIRSR